MGETGLIGTSLQDQTKFNYCFSSKNIHTIEKYLEDGCEIWLSCLPATKWQVNKNLEEDIYNMQYIIKLLRRTKFSTIVLFSTIDVYEDSPKGSNETYHPTLNKFSYGSNRRFFELMVKDFLDYDNLKIIRLPALFGKHIKKNIVYDLLNNNLVDQIKSTSCYQWYDLKDLYTDVIKRLDSDYIYHNLFPEPIQTQAIIDLFPEYKDIVDKKTTGVYYNYNTIATDTGYLYNSELSLTKLKEFINETRSY